MARDRLPFLARLAPCIEFRINEGRQLDRMFCEAEYDLRMMHGNASSTNADYMTVTAPEAFYGVRDVLYLRRIIARRMSAAACRIWRPPSLVSSVERAKRHREEDGVDPGSGGSVEERTTGGLRAAFSCVAWATSLSPRQKSAAREE